MPSPSRSLRWCRLSKANGTWGCMVPLPNHTKTLSTRPTSRFQPMPEKCRRHAHAHARDPPWMLQLQEIAGNSLVLSLKREAEAGSAEPRRSHVGQKPWGEMPSEERCTLYTYAQHVHNNTSANVSALTWWMTVTVCYFNTRGMTTYKLIQSQSNGLHLNIQQIRWHQTWFWALFIFSRGDQNWLT